MRRNPANRLLALVLALVMVLGLVPVSGAAAGLVWNETDLAVQPDQSHRLVNDSEKTEPYAPADTVRVSIVLEDAPTAGAGFATKGIALDGKAAAYDQALVRTQKAMEQTISAQALGGKEAGRGLESDPGCQHHLRQCALRRSGRHPCRPRRQSGAAGAAVQRRYPGAPDC